MSLFATPQEHAANPPSTWRIEKAGVKFALVTADGTVIHTYRTRSAALTDADSGFFVTLYNDESRWYAGEQVRGWRPYTETRKAPV